MPGLVERATRERDQEIQVDMRRRLRHCAGENNALLCLELVLIYVFFSLVLLLEKFLPFSDTLYAVITTPLLYGVTFLVIVPSVIIWGNRGSKEELKNWMKLPKEGYLVDFRFMIRWILIGVGVTQLLNYLASGLFFLVGMITGMDLVGAPAMIQPDSLNRLATFLAAVIAAPVLEEVLFRATILRRALHYGQWFAIVASAGACALINPKPSQMVNAFILGMVCGYVMVKTKSVWPSVAIHLSLAFLTTTSLVVNSFLISDGGHLFYHIFRVTEGTLLVTISVNVLRLLNLAAILSGVFLLVKEVTFHRIHFLLENAMPGLSAGQKTWAFFSAPASILLVVLAAVMLILNGYGLDLGSFRWLTLL